MRCRPRFLRLAIAVVVACVIAISASTTPFATSAQGDTVPGKPSGLSTEAGDTQVRLSWDDPTDSSITGYQLWMQSQRAKLTATSAALDDDFGNSVAVVGDVAVVGAPRVDDGTKENSGAVFVFTRDASTGSWTQAVHLTANDAAGGDLFGNSVGFDGETIVVGAPNADHGGFTEAGAAYVFNKPASGWATGTEDAKLTASDAAKDDLFGSDAVAVDGDTIVVGAYGDEVNTGAAYVYTKSGNEWGNAPGSGTHREETAKLTGPDGQQGDNFGDAVAVDNDTVVVGASGNQNPVAGTDVSTGAAYVFVKPTTSNGWADWDDSTDSETAKLTASDGAAEDEFGRSVAVDDDTIVAGANGDEGNTGAAYVFTKPGTGWADRTEDAKLTASDGADDDTFGWSVAIDGDTVVVGANGNDGDRGSAYVFTKPSTAWANGTETAKLTASDGTSNDEFGIFVAVDGDAVVVGASGNQNPVAGTDVSTGAAYVFDIVDWEGIADSDAATTSHIVRGLTNGIEHTFRVRAVNTVGETVRESVPSDSVSETPTAASYAPARPANFSAQQPDAGQVELKWDAHLYPLTVTGYEFHQDDGGGPIWTDIAGSDSGTDSHTITGLDAGAYTFAVRAVNSAGEGASSDSQSITIPDKPTAPDSFAAIPGDGLVWLGWRSPLDFTITGYQYQQGEGDWTDIPGSRAGTTFHVVTGLANGTPYSFKVRAVNVEGESDASAELTATPAAARSAPSKPTTFSAEQTGVWQVELTWDASSDPLTVAGYQYTQNGGSGWTTIPGSDPSTVSHTVTGLAVGNYRFGVRAVNSVGATTSDYHSVTVIALPGAPNGLAATAGDTQVGLTWSNLNDASVNKFQLLQVPENIRLVSNDLAGGDELGWSVAVDGDTLVIGALGDEPLNTGAAYVFTRDAGGWTQVGKLTALVRRDDAGFGSSVAVHGDTIVVGAYEDDLKGSNAGAAYVFTKPATGWGDMTETARLTGSNTGANDEFGSSVAVYGDTIVVGAPEQSTNAIGSTYIFTKPDYAWKDSDQETVKLQGESNGDRFGRSVAIFGGTVVVGALEVDDDKGAAYVFTKRAAIGVWDDWNDTSAGDATAKLTASDRGVGDDFGRAVAFDGETIVVGAPYNDDPDNSGSAYVFTKPETGWADANQPAKLTAPKGAANDSFGYSVALDGDTVVVGAFQADSFRGSAYAFTKPDTGWVGTPNAVKLTAYDRKAGDRFGHSVAVHGGVIAVGAYWDENEGDGANDDKGSAYVFSTEAAWADIPGSDAGTASHIATRLPNDLEHTFQVRAVNAAGAGAGSNSVLATPKAAKAAPAAPVTPSVKQTGVGQVELEWDEGTNATRLTITGYQYKKDTDINWTNIYGSDSSTNSHTVTGLTDGTAHTFAVRAKNSFDEGNSSANSDNVIPVALPAAPMGFSAAAGDTQVSLSWSPSSDKSITKYQLLQFEPNKLIDDNGLQDDNFGYSVAVDGDTAVIGVYHDNLPGAGGISFENVGSAYVFVRQANSGGWRQVAHLTASDADGGDEFGYSVGVDGDTIVVGARQADHDTGGADAAADTGAVYVFTKPDNGWADGNETAKLTAYEPMADDEFGISVAVDGDTILVGAHQNDDKGADAGAAYLFTRPYTGWADSHETTKLIPADGKAGDEFGISVAVDGDTAVIGANKVDYNGDDSGSAYVFTEVSGVWSQQAKFTASDGVASDGFGISVAVDDGTIVVGAHQHDVGGDGNKEGAAYVFTKPANGWVDGTETDKLTDSDGAADDEFGYSVAVDGDRVLVGAHLDDDHGENSGSVYLFSKDATGGWIQAAKLTAHDGAANDRYGYSVAVSGNSVLVGAYSDDSIDDSGAGVADTGAAYLSNISHWTDLQGSGVSHDVTGLTNGVKYTFRIRGLNAAGGGLASANASATPQIPNPLQPTALSAEAGDTQITVVWNDRNDPLSTTYQLLQLPETRLTADDGAANDEFGVSVAIDGDTAVMGAPGRDTKDADGNVIAADAGVVYVFVRDAQGVWRKEGTLTASDRAANDEFGASVAVDGDTIVVGAPGDESGKGSVYVFAKPTTANGWADTIAEPAKLTASDGATNDEFGISVAVSGGTIAVGAPVDESDEGSAYVFAKPALGWGTVNQTAKLTASDGAANDEFGISVAVDGDIVVVGASEDESGKGSVYVFAKPTNGTGWDTENDTDTETAKLTASDGAANDEFGISVDVDGNTIVVGARGSDGTDNDGNAVTNSGAAYVFAKPKNGNWATSTETAKLTASNLVPDREDQDAGEDHQFGQSVAVEGATIVVGSWGDNDGNTGVRVRDSGSAYVFALGSGVWSETLKFIAYDGLTDDNFGSSVAVAGETVLVGSPGDDGPSDSGSAYSIDLADWVDINTSDIAVSQPNDSGSRTYSHRVTGLTNDQLYVYRVRAVNAGGNAPTREIDDATPLLSKPDKPTGLTAAAGNRRVDLSWDPSDDSTIEGYQVLHFVMNKLTATDRAEDDEFGHSVAMDDGIAVVGAPKHDANDVTNSGAAYVFARNSSGRWSQVAKLTASDGGEGNEFGHSVAVHGGTVVIGAYKHNGITGSAYVFTRDEEGAWSQEAKLTASDGDTNDWFGHSVAVHGDTVVVGAPRHDTNDINESGAAYVFTKSNGVWVKDALSGTDRVETAKLTAAVNAEFDRFGYSVAVYGTVVVVGAYFYDGEKGAVYVFAKPSTDGGWGNSTETAILTASDGDDDDQFGYSVAVDDDTVVVGARHDDEKKGSAYFFVKPTTSNGWADWDDSTDSETAKLTASDSEKSDEFGYSVALNGDTVVIGAYNDKIDEDDESNRSGSAYMFAKPEDGWVNSIETAKLILPAGVEPEESDNFGNSVAVDGESIIVGAPRSDADDLANDNSGSIYELLIPQWTDITPSGETTASHTVTGLTNGVEYTFQVRAVDKLAEVGLAPGSDSVRAMPVGTRSGGGRDNWAPSFGNISNLTRAVEENTSPGALVGGPIRASDPDGDSLTYSLSGTDASSFSIGRATGQLTVKDVLDYETKSVYQVKVLASDHRNASNGVDVTINVTNVEEAGTLVVSPEQPELGVALTATLSDPDGLISASAWQWSRSADGSTGWSDIAGADSNSYTPVLEDVDHYLRVTVTYTDGHGSGKSATAITEHQVPEGQIINTAPTFGSIDRLTLTIDENAPPNTPVGFPVVALDREEDTLTYSLSGTHAALFRIEGSNGQITVGPNTTLDYESGPLRYTVIVSVHDGRDAYGDSDTAIDDYIDVHIDVNDVDEAGAVTVSLEQPKVKTALTATLSDLDGSVTAVSWQWAISTDGVDWEDIPGATSSTYTPVDADADKYVRVTAYYTDGEGVGKQEQAVLREPVRAFSTPAPTLTPTPMAPPTTPSDVPSAAVVPTPASDGGVPPASTPEQVADDNGIALWLILLIAAVAAVVAVGLIIVGIRIIRAPAG